MFTLYKKLLSQKVLFGSTLGAAIFFMIIGVIYWGGFHMALEATNDMGFCIGCHEMENNVYQEYTQTIHFKNPSGVRAGCPDCHVPKEWEHMIVRKITATNELFHKLAGTIDSKEKFNAKRLQLAQQVWQSLEDSDSRECRNCHDFNAMSLASQGGRAGLVHRHSLSRNKTCIDCHKGIAHQLPDGVIPYRGGSDEDHDLYQSLELPCYQCHQDMAKPDDEQW